jgi:hypothetical protein
MESLSAGGLEGMNPFRRPLFSTGRATVVPASAFAGVTQLLSGMPAAAGPVRQSLRLANCTIVLAWRGFLHAGPWAEFDAGMALP